MRRSQLRKSQLTVTKKVIKRTKKLSNPKVMTCLNELFQTSRKMRRYVSRKSLLTGQEEGDQTNQKPKPPKVDGDKKKVIKRTKKSKQPKGEDVEMPSQLMLLPTDEQPKDEVVTTEIVPDLEKDEEITIEEITVTVTKKKVIKRN
ncbi:hypothetical protein TYRP_010204 [Tyrophagus putrescentiae]|nr:hypothetical protein TYRP_010204 [Tyrophagus putrescentiae]